MTDTPSERVEQARDVWRAVEGWPYDVSNTGLVRRSGKATRGLDLRGYVLKPALIYGKSKTPYLQVVLIVGARRRSAKVHHLVLEAFVGMRPTPKHQANHIDGDKANNHVENLEWVTASENMRHAIATGLLKVRPRNVKIGEAGVVAIRAAVAAGTPRRVLAKQYGVDRSSIDNIVLRRTWKEVA